LSDPNALFQVNNVINKLEQSHRTQTDMDSIYEDWCNVIKQHMYSTIPYKTITVGIRNKNRRPDKPWWSDMLIYQISGLKCVRRNVNG